MVRKTVTIASLKATANAMLADSVPEVTDARIAVALLLEHMLMEAGAYHGFRYLPGVMDFSANPPRLAGDDTRRAYL